VNEKYREFRLKLLNRSPKALKQMAADAGFPALTDTTDKEVLLEELFGYSEGLPVATAPAAQKAGVPAAPDAGTTSTSERGQAATSAPATESTRSVRAIKAHYRCGHYWTPVREVVPVKEFNEAQWETLRADKGLQIQDG
jgi:hypothetical protein